MRSTVRALLSQFIDYAGLFPPAKQPLDAALDSYLHERRSSPHRWMLGRFICPAARLPELLTLAQRHADRSLLQLTVLGQQSSTADEFLPHVRADVEAIESFRQAWDQDAMIDVFEVALPKGATIAQLQAQLPYLPDLLGNAGLCAFFEIPTAPSWRANVSALTDTLHDLHHTQPHGSLGMKLRCGGLTAEAFPTDADVAYFLDRCGASHRPWKATAGLHHPRRHWDTSLNVWHHGFLNVFVAGLLGRTHVLNDSDLVSILSDRDLLSLRCEDDCIAYRAWSCSATQIVDYRKLAASFGSCSFAEPCAELKAMGWLDAAP